MTLNSLITKLLQSRSSANWKGASRRKTHDNFAGPMGRLRQFMSSYPEDTPRARQTFFGGIYRKDAEFVSTGNKAGRSLIDAIDKLKP